MWQIVLEADRQNVPVVLMTGDPAQMKEAERGARPYIFKPFSLSDLKRILENAGRRQAAGDTPAFVGRSAFLSEPDPSSRIKRPQATAGGLRFLGRGFPRLMSSDARLEQLQRDFARLRAPGRPRKGSDAGRGRDADHPGEIPRAAGRTSCGAPGVKSPIKTSS